MGDRGRLAPVAWGARGGWRYRGDGGVEALGKESITLVTTEEAASIGGSAAIVNGRAATEGAIALGGVEVHDRLQAFVGEGEFFNGDIGGIGLQGRGLPADGHGSNQGPALDGFACLIEQQDIDVAAFGINVAIVCRFDSGQHAAGPAQEDDIVSDASLEGDLRKGGIAQEDALLAVDAPLEVGFVVGFCAQTPAFAEAGADISLVFNFDVEAVGGDVVEGAGIVTVGHGWECPGEK